MPDDAEPDDMTKPSEKPWCGRGSLQIVVSLALHKEPPLRALVAGGLKYPSLTFQKIL